MKSIRIPGEIDKNNQLILDESLDVIKPQRVEIDIWFDDGECDQEPTKAEVFEGIREGLHDCLTGNTFASMSEMWDSLRIQATGLINEDGNLLLDQPLRKIAPQDVSVVIWFINKNQPQLEIAEDSQQDDRRNTARELSIL